MEYLLKAVHVLFPEVGLRPDEVVAAWAGLRPLVRADGATTYQTSREHEVFVDPQGIATIAGGKLTTCRMMAEELVDEALALLPPERREAAGPCRTKKVPLLAAAGLSRPKDALSLVRELARRPDVEAYLAEHLVTTFGALAPALLDGPLRDQAARAPMIPGLPYTWGEVAVQAEHGFARTTADILRRRTRVYFQAPDQGLSVCDEVARRLGAALARSEEEIAADAEAYRTEVAASRAWRAELGEPTEASSL